MPSFNIKIAGQVGAVECRFDSTPYYLARYVTQDAADFAVSVTDADLERERQFRDAEALEEGMKLRKVTEPFLERLAIQRKIAEELMNRDILMVHGSAVAVDGVGYIFTARCGTGKSTHTRLWREVFGDRAVMINDDKPFIRIASEGITVCGAPWSGKHGLDTNTEVPLGGICLLERGKENRIRPLLPEEIPELAKNLRWFMEPDRIPQFNALAEKLYRRVPLWHLDCNMDPGAAALSHGAMSGKQPDKLYKASPSGRGAPVRTATR